MHIPKSIVIAAVTGIIVLSACVVVSTVAMDSMRSQMWQMYADCPHKPAR